MDASPSTVVHTHPDRVMVAGETTDPNPLHRGPSAPPDDFARDQSNVQRLFNLPDADAETWLDGLTIAESRRVLIQLGDIESEHARRARGANVVADRVRSHLASASGHGLPTAVGMPVEARR